MDMENRTSWVDVEDADITAVGRAMIALLKREERRPNINSAYRAAVMTARVALENVSLCFW